MPREVAQTIVILLMSLQGVSDLNFSWANNYFGRGFYGFPQIFQANAEIIP
jgi:hypothetical protein